MTSEELQQFRELQKTVKEIQIQRLPYNLDVESKKIIERTVDEFLSNKIFNLVWNDYFYYFESFNSTESLAISAIGVDSGAGFTATPQPVFYLVTGATLDNSVLVGKFLFQQEFLTFDKKQFFRTQFQVDSVANLNADINVGDITTNDDAYGFRIVNNALKGIVKRATSETLTSSLQTIVADTTYQIEARLDPDEGKVIFSVNGEERGILNVIPTRVANNNVWSFRLETDEAVAKTMYIQTFELIQKR